MMKRKLKSMLEEYINCKSSFLRMREITFGMLVGIKIDGNKNPLLHYPPFISWAKTEGGCWWWIRNGARECLGAGMIISRRFGSPEGIKKEFIEISLHSLSSIFRPIN